MPAHSRHTADTRGRKGYRSTYIAKTTLRSLIKRIFHLPFHTMHVKLCTTPTTTTSAKVQKDVDYGGETFTLLGRLMHVSNVYQVSPRGDQPLQSRTPYIQYSVRPAEGCARQGLHFFCHFLPHSAVVAAPLARCPCQRTARCPCNATHRRNA